MNLKEGQKIEFKLVWNDNAYKTACAFANTEGGKLYIGYDDAGNLVGIKRSKEDMENLPNSIRSKLNLFVSIYAGTEGGKDYLEVNVPAMDYPIFYDGKIYIRVGSTNQLLEGNELISFILRKGKDSWDAVTIPNIGIDDLDEESFRILLDDGIRNKRLTEYDRSLSKRKLLEKMSLIKDGKLTRAAVLLFHPKPYRIIPCAYVQIGRFRDDATILYKDILQGSLMTLCGNVIDAIYTKYYYNLISYDRTT